MSLNSTCQDAAISAGILVAMSRQEIMNSSNIADNVPAILSGFSSLSSADWCTFARVLNGGKYCRNLEEVLDVLGTSTKEVRISAAW